MIYPAIQRKVTTNCALPRGTKLSYKFTFSTLPSKTVSDKWKEKKTTSEVWRERWKVYPNDIVCQYCKTNVCFSGTTRILVGRSVPNSGRLLVLFFFLISRKLCASLFQKKCPHTREHPTAVHTWCEHCVNDKMLLLLNEASLKPSTRIRVVFASEIWRKLFELFRRNLFRQQQLAIVNKAQPLVFPILCIASVSSQAALLFLASTVLSFVQSKTERSHQCEPLWTEDCSEEHKFDFGQWLFMEGMWGGGGSVFGGKKNSQNALVWICSVFVWTDVELLQLTGFKLGWCFVLTKESLLFLFVGKWEISTVTRNYHIC